MAQPMLNGKSVPAKYLSACGFTYIGLLLVISIAGIAMAAAGMTWHYKLRAEKERQLLFVGKQFNNAITSYYDATPADTKQYPRSLDDLLLDRRFPKIKRHLRQLYSDPITGSNDWGLVRQGQRIVGVYSLSKQKPFKLAGFDPVNQGFSGAASYQDWVFGQATTSGPSSGPLSTRTSNKSATAISPSIQAKADDQSRATKLK